MQGRFRGIGGAVCSCIILFLYNVWFHCRHRTFIRQGNVIFQKQIRHLNSIADVLGPSALNNSSVYLPLKVLRLSIKRSVSAHFQKCCKFSQDWTWNSCLSQFKIKIPRVVPWFMSALWTAPSVRHKLGQNPPVQNAQRTTMLFPGPQCAGKSAAWFLM